MTRTTSTDEEQLIAEMRVLVREALELRRHVVTYEIATRFRTLLDSGQVSMHALTGPAAEQWERIESLSRLRQLVGGRFQNLKERWTQAGFPLREHRGDRSGKSTLRQEGWLDLAAWIGKHGFEARLAEDGADGLFEVRRIVSGGAADVEDG